jgi:hypothetical protein
MLLRAFANAHPPSRAVALRASGQHAAMYAAFSFSGLCDLASLAPAASRVVGFAALSQAFGIELLLFWCAPALRRCVDGTVNGQA